MTAASVVHATIVVERVFDASPERVFAAWSTAEALLRWGSPGEGWHVAFDRFEFRVGGQDVCRFGPPGGGTFVNATRYEDIVPNRRIVSSGAMTSGDTRLSVGLMTVELHPAGAGCRLVMTEQAAFLDGHDQPANHQAGWNAMLDKLGVDLRRSAS